MQTPQDDLRFIPRAVGACHRPKTRKPSVNMFHGGFIVCHSRLWPYRAISPEGMFLSGIQILEINGSTPTRVLYR